MTAGTAPAAATPRAAAHDDGGLPRKLAEQLQGEVRFDAFTRGRYSTDASIYQIKPAGVVLPRSAADIAAPLRIATLAIDPPERALALLRERGQPIDNAYADARSPRAVLDAWGGPNSALPVAVAIDAHGQVCGRKLGLLGTDQLREWASRCSR